jgi:hypothetical protein
MDDSLVHVVLAIERGADTIRGSVDDVTFTGWLELMSALDAARGAAAGDDDAGGALREP